MVGDEVVEDVCTNGLVSSIKNECRVTFDWIDRSDINWPDMLNSWIANFDNGRSIVVENDISFLAALLVKSSILISSNLMANAIETRAGPYRCKILSTDNSEDCDERSGLSSQVGFSWMLTGLLISRSFISAFSISFNLLCPSSKLLNTICISFP